MNPNTLVMQKSRCAIWENLNVSQKDEACRCLAFLFRNEYEQIFIRSSYYQANTAKPYVLSFRSIQIFRGLPIALYSNYLDFIEWHFKRSENLMLQLYRQAMEYKGIPTQIEGKQLT